ncbi:glycoprotease [Selenomonas sp. oral taxon 136]|uniref:glycoprotease n=1 Tax=Selenomonas sp. oral taxon 136 TaxID=713030 RepID=UPI000A957F32|nr:glycoprotease [Selenomonas sp. oral taxon 136]
MLERVKQTVTTHKTGLLVILCLLIVGLAYAVGRYSAAEQTATEKPALMTQEQTQDVKELKNRLDISTANANALEKRITTIQAGQRAPTTMYYVTAPTVERAAQVVERQIRTDDAALPMAARENSDRTVVTPITKDVDGKDLPADQQKVDVYKINLRKDHRIKAGATMIDGKALMSVGYEQGRFEALAHFDGGKYKGATVMYNVAEW